MWAVVECEVRTFEFLLAAVDDVCLRLGHRSEMGENLHELPEVDLAVLRVRRASKITHHERLSMAVRTIR